jgi:anthranilate synthase/aminodeoxychorismate synthase-like glutamine amidotransferase
MSNILLIDNFDSFTFNLVESFERLGCTVKTVRNTIPASSALELAAASDALIVLSPGPGRPEDAGCCLELVARASGWIPLLGICLGHQAIIAEAGGRVERAPRPVHGKASLLEHDGSGPFAGIESPIRAGRYHSLGVKGPLQRFRVHAWADGIAMAISDGQALQAGLQFHPESILTREGDRILSNILGAPGARGNLPPAGRSLECPPLRNGRARTSAKV